MRQKVVFFNFQSGGSGIHYVGRIPKNFVKNFGCELSKAATLIDPNGRISEVRIRKNGKTIWFHHGWYDFIKYYSISAGYLVVFKYVKNSTFHVLIFDMTACEINYPSKSEESKNEEFVEKEEPYEDNECDLQDFLEEMGICIARKHRIVTTEQSKRAVKFVESLELKNPSFMVILQQSDINHHRVYVPVKFAKEFFCRDTKSIKILVSNENEKPHQINWIQKGGFVFTMVRIMKSKKLKEGDICIFELIRKNKFLLKLYVLKGK
ncbi:B3 domain-containing transcription factor VRN1-like isoform X2 [Citrus sinensis]|uniref:B3 domain-containing transcription factor VRN1-like isoform X2 n=1 Tax=Citrus sinensis TaxID=2711 RepID=UPI002277DCBD|nr:B3 domain-containing transcription factor VRN1-like isoform X2 [Citrus sinensis]